MSAPLDIRAPGKLFLLGEYAVLDGCPALVVAVDRHVAVRIATDSSGARIRIGAPDIAPSVEFPASDPPPAIGALRFVLSAIHITLAQVAAARGRGFDVQIRSDLAESSGQKIGLGSSAAVTVATVGALCAAAGWDLSAAPTRDQIFALAFAAHRAAQGNVGSGGDVAASCYGGLVCIEPRPENAPSVSRLELPPDATLLVGWTGLAATTTQLVEHYLAARNGAAPTRTVFVKQTRDCVEAFRNLLARGAISLAALNLAGDALDELGEALDLPLQTPALRELVRIARAHGAGAKLSGAGGGDCGIALTQHANVPTRIRDDWAAAGITPLDLHLAPQGVHVVEA